MAGKKINWSKNEMKTIFEWEELQKMPLAHTHDSPPSMSMFNVMFYFILPFPQFHEILYNTTFHTV